MNPMIFAGVGPGDPELLSIKAARAIQSADTVAVVDSGTGEPTAGQIVNEWISEKEILHLSMPMYGERKDWREAHRNAANTLLRNLAKGKRIVYPVLGDPLLYATSSYLLRLIEPHHPCEVIPGIPALCAAAAALKIPLAESRERLTLLSGYDEGMVLPEGNVVVMKAGRTLAALKSALSNEQRPAWVVQKLGMEGAAALPIDDFNEAGKQSYFTTVLIKRGKKDLHP